MTRRLKTFESYKCYRCDAEFAIRTGVLDGTAYCPNCGGNDAVEYKDLRILTSLKLVRRRKEGAR